MRGIHIYAVGALAIVFVCVECGGGVSTPTQFCDQYVQSGCHLLYTCNTGAQLASIQAQYGPTEMSCVAKVEGQLDCAHAACSTGTFSPSAANACINALNSTSCADFQQGPPLQCNNVCTSAPVDGGGQATPQGAVLATVQPIPNDTTDSCATPTSFETIGDPSTSVVVSGTAGVTIACTVTPLNGGYQVTASATSGTSRFTIDGLIMPRPRDANGNPSQDSTFVVPNITATFQDSTKSLQQSNCVVQYLEVSNGQPGASLPSVADVYADNNGGRVWASVFCNDAGNAVNDPQVTACSAAATFRFENCTP